MSLEELKTEISEIKNLLLDLNIQQKEYLNIEEASKFLGISKSSLYKYTSSNSIVFYKPNGKLVLFKKEDLIKFVEKGRVNSHEDYNDVAEKMIKQLKI